MVEVITWGKKNLMILSYFINKIQNLTFFATQNIFYILNFLIGE